MVIQGMLSTAINELCDVFNNRIMYRHFTAAISLLTEHCTVNESEYETYARSDVIPTGCLKKKQHQRLKTY